MTSIAELIAESLRLPIDEIERAISLAPYRTKKFVIPKRSGGQRTILQPSSQIKPVLYWLQAKVFDNLPVHPIATAFRKQVSILDNASAHRYSLYSVRIDIADFFPSIRPLDARSAIVRTSDLLPDWATTEEALDIISKVCFDRSNRLPIGYTTSPSIANAVMFPVDARIAELITKKERFGNAVLTRYADDFVFSTDQVGACREFVELLVATLRECHTPQLSINAQKTRYMSRMGGSTLITGLRVNNQGGVVVHPNYRDHVRLLLKLYREERIRDEDIPKLVGHLAHVQHVDPAFFTKLSFKYFVEIKRLRESRQ